MLAHPFITTKSAKFVAICALMLSALMLGHSNTVEAQSQPQFICETPVTVPESMRVAYEEHYQCTDSLFEDWFSKYPAEVAQLQKLYQAWQSSRRHDLRGQQAAGQWVQQYPVDFSSKRVELTKAQAREIGPTQSGEPVQVNGEFERLFVDRDNRRLFLTSKEEGLVSIGIARRYAFTFEGKVGQAGAREFFVYDKNTALVEETNAKGGNRDLVVLDISNRSNPREIARLRGAVPEIGGAMLFHPSMMSSPPTFEQYRSIREGVMSHSSCGARPTVHNQANVHCRPDGSCFETKVASKPEGICVAMAVQSQPISKRPSMRPRPTVMSDSLGTDGFDMGNGRFEQENRALESVRKPDSVMVKGTAARAAAAPQKKSAERPAPTTTQGGAGGAGSLSQMMVYGKTLYVLSGAEGNPHGVLTTFDLSDRKNPRIRQVLDLNNGPEALQRHDNLLLIAGRDGVVTASLGVESRPRLLGEFRQNCPVNRDPIVVQGSIGYRTIIVEGRRINCTSRLEVLDLSQPHQPMLRATYPIQQPRGLSVLGDRLFVADEYQGVLVFDIGDKINPSVVGTWSMSGVKDLVLSDFDLYAMSGSEIKTFYVGPLYERGLNAAKAFEKIEGIQTVVSVSKALVQDRMR